METQEIEKPTGRSVWEEIKDLCTGAAFPLIVMLVLCASIVSYASYGEEVELAIAAVVLGDVMLVIAYVIFGKQNGIAGLRKSILQSKKRELGTADFNARHGVGEYALWKGFVIAFITCLPFLLVQVIGGAAPNSVCSFLLEYAFGWAYYPLSFAGVSVWCNLIWIIPLCAVHAGAYAYGAHKERERQNKVIEAQRLKDKKAKK